MNIPLQSDDNITVTFDLYGNLYFTHNNKTYQPNIDGRNNLSLDPIKYSIVQPASKKLKKIVPTSKKLEKRVKEDIEASSEEEEPDYLQEDDDYFNDEKETSEDSYDDSEIIDEDIINRYGESNKQFIFASSTSLPIESFVFDIEDSDICALYDCYLYKDNILFFKSSSLEEDSIYRIRIYDNGDLFFRPIGGPEKHYSLKNIITNT